MSASTSPSSGGNTRSSTEIVIIVLVVVVEAGLSGLSGERGINFCFV